MAIKVKGVATVVGGTNATYSLGVTEAFAYHTAFRAISGAITQVGTAGGVVDWSIKEHSTTCTLYITTSNNELQFGLDDSQTDTKRIWQLSVDIDVNNILSLETGYGLEYAEFQNGDLILFQDGTNMIWN